MALHRLHPHERAEQGDIYFSFRFSKRLEDSDDAVEFVVFFSYDSLVSLLSPRRTKYFSLVVEVVRFEIRCVGASATTPCCCSSRTCDVIGVCVLK